MKYLIIAGLLFTFLFSCTQEGSKKHEQELPSPENSSRTFSVIEKDCAYILNYRISKQTFPNGTIVFSYKGHRENFAIICDTANRAYRGIFTKADTVIFDLEVEKFYTVNGKDFKLLKLIADKNVTDGATSYFFNPEIGLLISKSNTWRMGKILNVDNNSKDYLQITALLFKKLTNEEMFKPPVPNIKKFTLPKFE
jgi:hypothetical protein